MSRDLQLKKGGRLFVKEWDNEENDFVEQEVCDEEFTFHLYNSVCLEKGITLRDIFLMIKNNLYPCIIVTGCPFLDDLMEEALSPSKKNEEYSGLVALRLSWETFIEEEDEGSSVIDHISFCGIGDKDYALEFIPLNMLSAYPIIINEEYKIQSGSTDEIYFSTIRKFSLIDVLRGIVDELSYMGPPDIREFALMELRKDVENDGLPKLFTPEDLENRRKERMEKSKKPCRICGEDARSADFGKPDDICPKCYKEIREN